MLNKAIFSAFFDTNPTNTKLINLNRSNNKLTNSTTLQYSQNGNDNSQSLKNSLNDSNYLICNHYLYIDNFFNNQIDIYNAFIIHKIVVSILCIILGMFFILVGK
jgi:hypothetical protein